MMHEDRAEDLPGDEKPRPIERRTRPQPLSPQAQKRLGVHLKAMYESVLQQPVPDRFANLIAQLDGSPVNGRAES